MISKWTLPTSLELNGVGFSIRTDYRDILTILQAFNDPDLPDEAKYMVMLQILYEDDIPEDLIEEAVKKGVAFIDMGNEEDVNHPQPRVMDWEQDASMIVSAINKVAGCEIRAFQYLHWWTFLGYYMEIGEGIFSQVINIRTKRAKGQKLEKWERDFERENKEIVRLKKAVSEEEQALINEEKAAVAALFGE